jgi:hypothetical protein
MMTAADLLELSDCLDPARWQEAAAELGAQAGRAWRIAAEAPLGELDGAAREALALEERAGEARRRAAALATMRGRPRREV